MFSSQCWGSNYYSLLSSPPSCAPWFIYEVALIRSMLYRTFKWFTERSREQTVSKKIKQSLRSWRHKAKCNTVWHEGIPCALGENIGGNTVMWCVVQIKCIIKFSLLSSLLSLSFTLLVTSLLPYLCMHLLESMLSSEIIYLYYSHILLPQFGLTTHSLLFCTWHKFWFTAGSSEPHIYPAIPP